MTARGCHGEPLQQVDLADDFVRLEPGTTKNAKDDASPCIRELLASGALAGDHATLQAGPKAVTQMVIGVTRSVRREVRLTCHQPPNGCIRRRSVLTASSAGERY